MHGGMREYTEEERHLIKLVAQGSIDELRLFLQQVPGLDLTQIWDSSGYNALHLAGYKNSLMMIQLLCNYLFQVEIQKQEEQKNRGENVANILPKNKLAQWINTPAAGDESFTVLHFAAFNGNVTMLSYLISMGAYIEYIHRNSKSKVSLFHVAAQGDSPGALALLKKIMEKIDSNIVNSRDIKQATPLHWACYAGAESAVQYLIAWGANVNAQDASGLTPLHNAVKSSEEIKSARAVRLLLIKGAERNIRDIYGNRPIDIAKECRIPNVQKELISYLVKITRIIIFVGRAKYNAKMYDSNTFTKSLKINIICSNISCSLSIQFCICALLYHARQYLNLMLMLIDQSIHIYMRIFTFVTFIISAIFFLLSWLIDPGFLKPNTNIDFISIIPKFDPSKLCAECELIKTKRCRHCNICNHCVERYDHHCPWINNCVGYRNHAYFYVYIFTLQLYMFCIFGIILLELRSKFQAHISLISLRSLTLLQAFINALKGPMPGVFDQAYFIHNVTSIVLLIICIIFMVPLIILVCVQTKNMISNETTSERFSRKREQNESNEKHEEDSSQYSDIDQRNLEDGGIFKQIVNNCLIMSCAEEFETQEELLEKKAKYYNKIIP